MNLNTIQTIYFVYLRILDQILRPVILLQYQTYIVITYFDFLSQALIAHLEFLIIPGHYHLASQVTIIKELTQLILQAHAQFLARLKRQAGVNKGHYGYLFALAHLVIPNQVRQTMIFGKIIKEIR